MSKNKVNQIPILYFDGGSRGNPGVAAGGAILIMPDGKQYAVSYYLPWATNNEAEYTGLIIGLEKAHSLGLEELIIMGDSQLVVNQVNGQWRVNSPNLVPLHKKATSLFRRIKNAKLTWVARSKNQLADGIVNQCIDTQGKGAVDSLVSKPEQLENETKPEDNQCPYQQNEIILVSRDGQNSRQGKILNQPILTHEGNWVVMIEILEN